MVDYQFEWSFDQDREENYRRWRQLNNAERDAYNVAQELEAGARKIFDQMEARWRSAEDQRRKDRNWQRHQFSSMRTTNSA